MSRYLRVDPEVALPCHARVDGELGRFIHDDAGRPETRTEGLHLRGNTTTNMLHVVLAVVVCFCVDVSELCVRCACQSGAYFLGEDVVGGGEDVRHEGAVLDVLVVADDVHGVVAGLGGPVAHVAGAVSPVVAFDLGLGRALDGEA